MHIMNQVKNKGKLMEAIIITDYKTVSKTFRFIKEAIYKINGDFCFIVVDNSQMHEAFSWLINNRIEFSAKKVGKVSIFRFQFLNHPVVVVDSPSNCGYAGGNNLGVKVCDSLFNVNYYIFSNNDIFFKDKLSLNSFSNIFKKHPDYGIIGTRVLNKDGQNQNPRKEMSFASQTFLWDFNNLLFHGRLNRYVWSLDQHVNESKETGWVSGSFMVVRKKAFNLVNGFDTASFLYCEEMILSEKMRLKGFKTFYDNDITLIHLHRGSLPNRKQRFWNHQSKIYFYRHYKNVSNFNIKFSDFMFEIIDFIYRLKHKEN